MFVWGGGGGGAWHKTIVTYIGRGGGTAIVAEVKDGVLPTPLVGLTVDSKSNMALLHQQLVSRKGTIPPPDI